MAVVNWWLEVWDNPAVGTTRKIASLPATEVQFNPTLNGVGQGSVTIPADYSRLSEILDVVSASEEHSLIKVFFDDDPDIPKYSFFAQKVGRPYAEAGQSVIDVTGPGVESVMDWAVVYPFDYPAAPAAMPDWVFGGGGTVLTNGGFEDLPSGVSNPGFEEGRLSPWSKRELDDQELDSDPEAVENATNARTGDWYAAVDPGQARTGIQRTIKVTPGKRYVIACYLKEPTASGERYTMAVQADEGYTLHTGAGYSDGEVIAELDGAALGAGATDGTWQTLTIDLTVGTEQDELKIGVQYHEATGNGAPFWLDDLTVTGWGMGCAPWEAPPGLNSKFELSTSTKRTGNSSLLVAASAQYGGARQQLPLIPGAYYRCEVWVSQSSGTAKNWRCFLRREGGGEYGPLSSAVSVPGDGTWTKLVAEGIQADYEDAVFVVRYEGTGASGDTYIDDAKVQYGFNVANPGEILDSLMDDAALNHASEGAPGSPRSVYGSPTPWLRYISFSDTQDSSTDPWTSDDDLSITIKRGKKYTQVLSQLAEMGYEWEVGWHAASSRYDLRIYRNGNLGTDRTADASPKLVAGAGISAGAVNAKSPNATQVFVEGKELIWDEAGNATLQAAFGRRELYIGQNNALDEAALQAIADNILSLESAATENITLTLVPAAGAPTPLVDFQVGDTLPVLLPDRGVDGDYRVRQIVAMLGEGGQSQFVVHLTDIEYDDQSATVEAINRLLDRFDALEGSDGGSPSYDYGDLESATATSQGGIPTILVAASDAHSDIRAAAKYKCDGTADQEEINLAIAEILALGFGRVVLSEGTFYLAGSITTGGASGVLGLVVEGAGIGATILTHDTSATAAFDFFDFEPTSGTVEDISVGKLTFSTLGQSLTGTGFCFIDGGDSRTDSDNGWFYYMRWIHDGSLQGDYAQGIRWGGHGHYRNLYFDYCDIATSYVSCLDGVNFFADCYFYGLYTDYGVTLGAYASGSNFSNCRFNNLDVAGIYGYPGPLVSGCSFSQTPYGYLGDTWLTLWNTTSGAVFVGNQMECETSAIDGCVQVVSGNYIDGCSSHAIRLRGLTSDTGPGILVTGNEITDIGGHGIYGLTNAGYVRQGLMISNNHFLDIGQSTGTFAAVYLAGNGAAGNGTAVVYIMNNVVKDWSNTTFTLDYAFYIGDNVPYAHIFGNDIYLSAGADLYVSSTGVTEVRTDIWQEFTPALTAETTSPTVVNSHGVYRCKDPHTVEVVAEFEDFSAAGSGVYYLSSLPYDIRSYPGTWQAEDRIPLGKGLAYDATATQRDHLIAVRHSATQVKFVGEGATGFVADSVPWSWTTDDSLHARLEYDIGQQAT